MNQKGFANIVLIVLVVLLAGALGYVTFVKKSSEQPSQSQVTPPTVTPPSKPSISIIFPNGGENFETEKPYTIKWGSSNLSPSTKIRIGYKPVIANSESGSFEIITTTNTGSFVWKTPKTVSGFNTPNGATWCNPSGTRVTRQYYLEVIALNQDPQNYLAVSDRSDATFNLTGPCFEGF
ncbi:MAG: hypothetical protein G01um101470_236 [Parcubacteria group bacterium Gr01-1014_70]|nr:MAG: hypothetical protein G01um101470_236 [Parcubacteria group bacterium Gr01-1014_70]